MQVPVANIERVIISHWHADHSGGLLSFLNLRGASESPCIIDLHPDRPTARGIAPPPNFNKPWCRLPPDPTFKLIEDAGGKVEKSKEGHVVADGTIWVSGEIPRTTFFEVGMPGAIRYFENDGSGFWGKEEVCCVFPIQKPIALIFGSISWMNGMLVSMSLAKDS